MKMNKPGLEIVLPDRVENQRLQILAAIGRLRAAGEKLLAAATSDLHAYPAALVACRAAQAEIRDHLDLFLQWGNEDAAKLERDARLAYATGQHTDRAQRITREIETRREARDAIVGRANVCLSMQFDK